MSDDGSDAEGRPTGVVGGDVTARVVVPLRAEVDYHTVNRSLVPVIDQTPAPTVIQIWTPETPRS